MYSVKDNKYKSAEDDAMDLPTSCICSARAFIEDSGILSALESRQMTSGELEVVVQDASQILEYFRREWRTTSQSRNARFAAGKE